jgi:hypothetical protein
MKITPDASLATEQAVQVRIFQLEEEVKKSTNPDEAAHLNRRIKNLRQRLSVGVEKTISNAALLKSKNDLL